MTSRIPPSRRDPGPDGLYGLHRAAKIVGQQTPGAGRVPGVARQGVSEAVAAAIRGKFAAQTAAAPTATPVVYTFTDNFNRANGALGRGWTTTAGGITSNKVNGDVGRPFYSDFDASWTVPGGVPSDFIFRFGQVSAAVTGVDFHGILFTSTGNIQIAHFNSGGTSTAYAGGPVAVSGGYSAGDTLRVTQIQGAVKVYKNGTLIYSVSTLYSTAGLVWLSWFMNPATTTIDDVTLISA